MKNVCLIIVSCVSKELTIGLSLNPMDLTSKFQIVQAGVIFIPMG